MTKEERAKIIFDKLANLYPNVETALKNWDGEPWKFVMCVVMSARTTDRQVNVVTETLFKKYPTLKSFASADIDQLTQDVNTIGFYRNKSKFLKGLAQMILDDFGGVVPMDVDEMQKLPGVGRKTANVVTGVLLDENFGIAVDTHVMRLSQRMGLTKNKTPEKIEKDLMNLYLDSKKWDDLSLLFIEHGRAVCKARNPKCERCVLNKVCLIEVVVES